MFKTTSIDDKITKLEQVLHQVTSDTRLLETKYILTVQNLEKNFAQMVETLNEHMSKEEAGIQQHTEVLQKMHFTLQKIDNDILKQNMEMKEHVSQAKDKLYEHMETTFVTKEEFNHFKGQLHLLYTTIATLGGVAAYIWDKIHST